MNDDATRPAACQFWEEGKTTTMVIIMCGGREREEERERGTYHVAFPVAFASMEKKNKVKVAAVVVVSLGTMQGHRSESQ